MRNIGLLALIILTFGCTDPIELDFKTEPGNFVVIDGFITTDRGPHIVNISTTSPFVNDDISLPGKVSGAEVSISDDLGETTFLFETSPGEYATPSNFRGLPGRTYTLEVNIRNDQYVSTPQTLPEPSFIDSLYYEKDKIVFFNSFDQEVEWDVINLLADVTISSPQIYAGFGWNGTFQYVAPLSAGQRIECFVDEEGTGFSRLLDPLNFGTIQKSVYIDRLGNGNRFNSRYSFNATLYTYGEEAHDYLSLIEDQVNSTGSVFDPQPFQINGNIKNCQNEDQVVLGFFGAYAVDSRRIFISKFELNFPDDSCIPVGSVGLPPEHCFDCRAFLGTYVGRPSFWR